MIHTDMGVAACLVGTEAPDRCLRLRLQWDIIVNPKWVNVGGQRLVRGVRVLPLVEGARVLGDLSHVIPGRVWRPDGRVVVPKF